MISRPFFLIGCSLALALALGACDGNAPWAGDGEAPDTAARGSLGSIAAYDRMLAFVGPDDADASAAVFDFGALTDTAGLHRGIRARVLADGEWQPLMDTGWEMDPMREPWLLVPHGPLKLLVGDEGDLDALVHQGDPAVRLDPGTALAEYTPDGGTQLMLRQGVLHTEAGSVNGILLDSQQGRALAATPAASSVVAAPGETPVLPLPRQGVEALLLDDAGFYVVFAPSANGHLVWLRADDQDDVRRGARLEPVEDGSGQDAPAEAADTGMQPPTIWRVVSPDQDLSGEVRTIAADYAALTGSGDASALGYVLVSGWIQDREVRREVRGLIRHVR